MSRCLAILPRCAVIRRAYRRRTLVTIGILQSADREIHVNILKGRALLSSVRIVRKVLFLLFHESKSGHIRNGFTLYWRTGDVATFCLFLLWPTHVLAETGVGWTYLGNVGFWRRGIILKRYCTYLIVCFYVLAESEIFEITKTHSGAVDNVLLSW